MPPDKTSLSVLFMVKECRADWMLLQSLNRKPCFEPRIRLSFRKYCWALHRHAVQCYMLSELLSSFSFILKLPSSLFWPTFIFFPMLLLHSLSKNKSPMWEHCFKVYLCYIRIYTLIWRLLQETKCLEV